MGSKKKETALALRDEGTFAVVRSDDSSERVSFALQQVGPGGEFGLQQLRVPTGGGSTWEVVTPMGKEPIQELECVIAHVQAGQKAWWRDVYSGGGTPPNCTSKDARVGRGNPSLDAAKNSGVHQCGDCRWNVFGSSRKEGTTGKDCKDYQSVYLFREGSRIPTVLTVPPTSLRKMQTYVMGLLDLDVMPYEVVTLLKLEQGSAGRFNPSVIVPTLIAKLNDVERGRMKTISELLASFAAAAPPPSRSAFEPEPDAREIVEEPEPGDPGSHQHA